MRIVRLGLIVAFFAFEGIACADIAPPSPLLPHLSTPWTLPIAVAVSLALGFVGIRQARGGGWARAHVLFAFLFLALSGILCSNSTGKKILKKDGRTTYAWPPLKGR
jgi:ABC-type Na+ efflux pump permease subunit